MSGCQSDTRYITFHNRRTWSRSISSMVRDRAPAFLIPCEWTYTIRAHKVCIRRMLVDVRGSHVVTKRAAGVYARFQERTRLYLFHRVP